MVFCWSGSRTAIADLVAVLKKLSHSQGADSPDGGSIFIGHFVDQQLRRSRAAHDNSGQICSDNRFMVGFLSWGALDSGAEA